MTSHGLRVICQRPEAAARYLGFDFTLQVGLRTLLAFGATTKDRRALDQSCEGSLRYHVSAVTEMTLYGSITGT